MLKIDVLRNHPQKVVGVLRGAFEGLGVEMTPRALLARLWFNHYTAYKQENSRKPWLISPGNLRVLEQ